MLPRIANTATVARTNATRLRMFARVAAFGFCIKQGVSLSDPVDRDRELHALLEMLDPLTRDALRRVLIRDQADRDAVASRLLRYGDERGDGWADVIDMLTMHPDEHDDSLGWRQRSTRSSELSQLSPVRLSLAEPQASRLVGEQIAPFPGRWMCARGRRKEPDLGGGVGGERPSVPQRA
jgi:hypothetical protein